MVPGERQFWLLALIKQGLPYLSFCSTVVPVSAFVLPLYPLSSRSHSLFLPAAHICDVLLLLLFVVHHGA